VDVHLAHMEIADGGDPDALCGGGGFDVRR
jgi:hypothetical protein